MSTPEIHALREGVALCREDHVHALRLRGEDCFELLEAVCTRPLFLRDGQMLPALFLHDDGRIFADVMVVVDDLDVLLLVEGPTPAELVPWLERHRDPAWDLTIEDLSATQQVLGVHGPYAWELLGELVGPEVMGVAYLRAFSMYEHDAICFRAGKTGEYGYQILMPRDRVEPFWDELMALGGEYGAAVIGVDDLDLAALENGFFSIRHGSGGAGPVELQLLWRVAYDRQAPGMEAVCARRGASTRVAWWRGEAAPENALHSSFSGMLGEWVALVEVPWETAPETALGTGRIVSPPLLHNRSLFIDVQRHTFAARHLDTFPDLVPA